MLGPAGLLFICSGIFGSATLADGAAISADVHALPADAAAIPADGAAIPADGKDIIEYHVKYQQ